MISTSYSISARFFHAVYRITNSFLEYLFPQLRLKYLIINKNTNHSEKNISTECVYLLLVLWLALSTDTI